MNKIAVFGGGHIGLAVALFLIEKGYPVTVFDLGPDSVVRRAADLGMVDGKNINIRGLVLTVNQTVAEQVRLNTLMGEFDYCVNALPYMFNKVLIDACVDSGVNYFDMSEDVNTLTYARVAAKRNPRILLAPACGLAPGAVSVVAGNMIRSFWKVDSVKIRVGALPVDGNLPGKHALTWSGEGMAHEYCTPGLAMHRGKLCNSEPLEGFEYVNTEFGDFEAFNTAGGIGTLINTMDADFRTKVLADTTSVNYKTLRWPGHYDIINFFRSAGYGEADMLKIFNKGLLRNQPDQIVIHITVDGWGLDYEGKDYVAYDGIPYPHKKDRTKYEWLIRGDSKLTAIQIATAKGLCATLDLALDGTLFRGEFRSRYVPNLVCHELIPFDLYTRSFGSIYRHRMDDKNSNGINGLSF